MAPTQMASGATRGTSESSELLVSPSQNEDVARHGESRRGSLRTAVRVAAVGACALVAGVAVGTHGNLGNVGSGVSSRPTISSLGDGRWGSAFDSVFDRRGSSYSASGSGTVRLRDGKPGKWGAVRGVWQGHEASGTVTRDLPTTQQQKLRSAPALKPTSKFPKWDRAPYEYEMPERNVDATETSRDNTPIPRDKVREGAAERQKQFIDVSDSDLLLSHPKVARAAEKARRFQQARLGEAQGEAVDTDEASESNDEDAVDTSQATDETSSDAPLDFDEPSYAYEESYDFDGSVSWEEVYVPPPAPPVPSSPPAPSVPTADAVAAIGLRRYNPAMHSMENWGQVNTLANDGVLKPKAESVHQENLEKQKAKEREEMWRRLEADGGKPAVEADAVTIGKRYAVPSGVSGENADDTGVATTQNKKSTSQRSKKPKMSKNQKSKPKPDFDAFVALAKKRENANVEDYDDGWIHRMELDEVVRSKQDRERENRFETVRFEASDYEVEKSGLGKSKKSKKLTRDEVVELRANHLMASLGSIDESSLGSDLESYESELAEGTFVPPETLALRQKEAKEKFEREEAEKVRLEKLAKTQPNADGSVPWDAPPTPSSPPQDNDSDSVPWDFVEKPEYGFNTKLRGELGEEGEGVSVAWDAEEHEEEIADWRDRPIGEIEDEKSNVKESSDEESVSDSLDDDSIPWDFVEKPHYVFNTELRSAMGGTEGVDVSDPWDGIPADELESSFVSAVSEHDEPFEDPQDSTEAVDWTEAFHVADGRVSDAALDAKKIKEKEEEEAYIPALSGHYVDDLVSGEELDQESAKVGEAKHSSKKHSKKHSKKQSSEESDEESVSWNDAKWHKAVTGIDDERDEYEPYQDMDPNDPDVIYPDSDVGGLGLRKSKKQTHKVQFDTRDYDMSDRASISVSAASEPNQYESELEWDATIPRYAELGEAQAVGGTDLGVTDQESNCLNAVPYGGPNWDEVLCQKYKNDNRQCQVHVAATQSCWHKTVGGQFLDANAANPELGARHGRGPVTDSEDSTLNAKWTSDFYNCMAGASQFTGDVEAPYRLPLRSAVRENDPDSSSKVKDGSELPIKPPLVSKHFQASEPNTSYFWNFVHVPKAGGTYFKSLLHAGETRRAARLGGLDPNWDRDLVQTWVTKPLVDFTEHSFANVNWRYIQGKTEGDKRKDGALGGEGALGAVSGEGQTTFTTPTSTSTVTPQFNGAGMKQSYQSGHRAVSKGSLSMGVCDGIDAPCAYLTVLRNPMERFMSHYVYSCLEGSEGMANWDAEWIQDAKRKGYDRTGCPLSPVEFHSRVGGSINLLAPGADPNSQCAVEAAKRNLQSPCVRFLLLDKLEDGLAKMRSTLPDFADIGVDAGLGAEQNKKPMPTTDPKTRHNESGDKLDAEKKKRLDAYLADAEEMNALKSLLAKETEVYQFAEKRYNEQWEESLQTC